MVPDLGAVTKPIAITLYFLPGNALIRALLNRNSPSLFISDVHKKGSNNVRRFFISMPGGRPCEFGSFGKTSNFVLMEFCLKRVIFER